MSVATIRLGDHFSIRKGKKVKETECSQDSVRYIQIDDLRNDNDIKYCDGFSKYVYAKPTDVIIAWDGANAGTVGYGLSGAIGSTLALLSTNNCDILSEYTGVYLQTQFSEIRSHCTGATIPHVSREYLASIQMPLPDKSVQERIVCSAKLLLNMMKKRHEQIAVLDKLARDAFVDMFGDPVTNPKGWPSEKIESYILFLTSGSRGWAKYYSESGEFFITIKNVKSGHILRENVMYVNAPKNKEAQRTKVQAKDLLISITADLGRTAVVDEDTANNGAYINQHLSILRLKQDEIVPEYLSAYLESPAGARQFAEKDQVGVKSGLNFDAIRSLQILMPPIELQLQYRAITDKIHKQKSHLQASLAELDTTYKSALQKAFNGELFQ